MKEDPASASSGCVTREDAAFNQPHLYHELFSPFLTGSGR